MTYDIADLREPQRHLAVTRFSTTPDQISTHMAGAFGIVYGYLGRHGIDPLGAPYGCYVMSGPEKWEVRVGCEVEHPITADDSVEPYTLPAGRTLSTVHVGPYEELGKAYEALEARAHELGIELDPAMMWEQYLSGPEVPPEETRTLIHWPVKA